MMARRDGRLGVGIIGAGKVGPIIGAALAGAGHAITGITSGPTMNVPRLCSPVCPSSTRSR